MQDGGAVGPDNTAVRVALWLALHVEADAGPHIFEDTFVEDLVAEAAARGVGQHSSERAWTPSRSDVPISPPASGSSKSTSPGPRPGSGSASSISASASRIPCGSCRWTSTRAAVAATLRQVAALAPGSTLVLSFLLPIEMADPEMRPGIERAAGFQGVERISAAELGDRYFAGRADGLRPPRNSEELLVATT